MSDKSRVGAPASADLSERYDDYVDDAVAFANGQLSPDAERGVIDRMKNDPIYRDVVKPILAGYEQERLTADDMDVVWPKMAQRIGLPAAVIEDTLGDDVSRARRRRRRMFMRAALAAAAAAFMAVGAWSVRYAMERRHLEVVSAGGNETIIRELPDGSTATVGPRSRLEYFADMRVESSTGGRRVFPRGEVTFQVAKVDDIGRGLSQPFVVVTELGRIRVTGTRFTVITLPGIVYVDLAEGSITIITPGLAAANGAGRDVEQAMTAPAKARITASGVEIRRGSGEGMP